MKKRHIDPTSLPKAETDLQNYWVNKEIVVNDFARVANNNFGNFKVLYKGQELNCALDLNLPKILNRIIVVGDFVILRSDNNNHYITRIVKRLNVLSRFRTDSTRSRSIHTKDEQIIAANIDKAIIVASLTDPPLKPSFIDRYLVLIQRNRIQPIICFNKNDLNLSPNVLKLENYYRSLGIIVFRTSTKTEYGIQDLKAAISNNTIVFIGQSGVGKSSLVNSILGKKVQKIGEVSKKNKYGCQTTTDSMLLFWRRDSIIIDTPGARALEVFEIPSRQLQQYYPEIQELGHGCRFSDCLHWREPENICAVKQAVISHNISFKRYKSYIRILEEL